MMNALLLLIVLCSLVLLAMVSLRSWLMVVLKIECQIRIDWVWVGWGLYGNRSSSNIWIFILIVFRSLILLVGLVYDNLWNIRFATFLDIWYKKQFKTKKFDPTWLSLSRFMAYGVRVFLSWLLMIGETCSVTSGIVPGIASLVRWWWCPKSSWRAPCLTWWEPSVDWKLILLILSAWS